MCGIVGQFSSKERIDRKIAASMLASILHRGPDYTGSYFEDTVFLGHNRLSIQDLSSAGNQPMWDAENEICIVFNGEIYNFKELRKELGEYSFKSGTDTEVIIYAYKKWGLEKALARFNGMFAFCLYDKRENKAFLVRDRIGIKPLLYYWNSSTLIFASELKAIMRSDAVKKEISEEAVADYFIYRYVANPRTIYKNVHKLEPGHLLELDLADFSLTKKEYWALQPARRTDKDESELLEEIESLLKDSVRLRLIADTPVASFLSGGVDSSLITSFANKLNKDIQAFSIDLRPKEYSEADYARILSSRNNVNLKVKKVGPDALDGDFDNMVMSYDEPFADTSFIPTSILCKFAGEQGFKCALAGEGGDEVFYGYRWYRTTDRHYASRKVINRIPAIRRLFARRDASLENYRRAVFNSYTVDEVNGLFGFRLDLRNHYLYEQKLGKNVIEPEEFSLLDFKTLLIDDMLFKFDISGMARSLEVRVPFLDHRLVELLFSVNFRQLYKNGELKYLSKQIAKRHIPAENIYRKKKGFGAPVMKWLGEDFRAELLRGRLAKTSFINKRKLGSLLEKERGTDKLWQMYMFEKWYSAHYDK